MVSLSITSEFNASFELASLNKSLTSRSLSLNMNSNKPTLTFKELHLQSFQLTKQYLPKWDISGLIMTLTVRATEFSERGCLCGFASSFHVAGGTQLTYSIVWMWVEFVRLGDSSLCSCWICEARALTTTLTHSRMHAQGKMERVHSNPLKKRVWWSRGHK